MSDTSLAVVLLVPEHAPVFCDNARVHCRRNCGRIVSEFVVTYSETWNATPWCSVSAAKWWTAARQGRETDHGCRSGQFMGQIGSGHIEKVWFWSSRVSKMA